MSTPDNPDPADFGPDPDDASVDEALAALTSGMPQTVTADEDEDEDVDLGEDVVGEGEDDSDEDDEDEGDEGDDAADDLVGALETPMAADAPIQSFEPGMEDMPDTSTMAPVEMGGDGATEFAPADIAPEPQAVGSEDQRLARLEALAEALITAENTREGGKVKRKVKAGASGAAVAGFIPVLLQLAGAFDLDPEVVATMSAGVAALASFVSGYLTPEREPALDPVVAHKVKQPRHKQRRRPRK